MTSRGGKFIIRYHEKVVSDDIPVLSKVIRVRVKGAIEQKLTQNPETYGKPLRRSLAGYRKLRVGPYRVVFKIVGRQVKVLCIGHRTGVYRRAEKRS